MPARRSNDLAYVSCTGDNQFVLAWNPAFVEVVSSEEPLDLVEQARRGDEASFNALFRLYENRVVRQAILLCGDETSALDLAQDTMFEAWKSVARYNGECRFFTWMCSILIHCHRRAIRRQRPTPFSWLMGFDRERAEEVLGVTIDAVGTPADAAQDEERARSLRR